MVFCFSYTKLNLNVISLVLSLIIVIFVNGIFVPSNKLSLNAELQGYYNYKDIDSNYKEDAKEQDWQIEIDKINLKAEIKEGTTSEILNKYVGHFEESQKDKGNICLAAHNRGYEFNYFERLKELKKGDKIVYTYNGIKRTYNVNLVSVIKETDWTNLENTEDNRITLITCVENKPEYRRCIQGIEEKNET